MKATPTYRPGRDEYELLRVYNALVKAGGRPVCPLGDIHHISNHPVEYENLLRPWTPDASPVETTDWTAIFERQLWNWHLFKAWQRESRDSKPSSSHANAQPAEGDTHNEPISDATTAITSFDKYAETGKNRLRGHGFTKFFRFDKEIDRQDRWTTWVEYLNFECYHADRAARSWSLQAEKIKAAPVVDVTRAETCPSHHGSRGAEVSAKTISESRCDGNSAASSTTLQEPCRLPSQGGSPSCNSAVHRGSPQVAQMAVDQGDASRGLGAKAPEQGGAERHDLILLWALLEEPKVAVEENQGRPSTTPVSAIAQQAKRAQEEVSRRGGGDDDEDFDPPLQRVDKEEESLEADASSKRQRCAGTV